MKNINSLRVFRRNHREVDPNGKYVLYWMSIQRRFHFNFALEYAVAWANKLGKPLLIYEGLSSDIPWASARTHTFLLQGMKEHSEFAKKNGINFYSYLETEQGAGAGLVDSLVSDACLIVADEYPVYIIRPYNRIMAHRSNKPWITVDSNGIIPLGATEKEPYSAFIFRKTVQKLFNECYANPPAKDPLNQLAVNVQVNPSEKHLDRWPDAGPLYRDIASTVSNLLIDRSVTPLAIQGTRNAAVEALDRFISNRFPDYAEKRNHPDAEKSSGLSAWLHYGKISVFEIVDAVFRLQPTDWKTDLISYQDGKRDGFYGGYPSTDAFLDELITWRETGFHFCHHVPNYDKYESLPDWALETLEEHASDPRSYIYSLEEFEKSQTHDPLWNAAQRQLVQEGIIHNYLRMLWGKKILEWTSHPRIALEYMIELNNKYAIDGRDPNSYTGIFWILGRFDRAWGPERPIFGKIRYMTSESTAKKVDLRGYMKKFGENPNNT